MRKGMEFGAEMSCTMTYQKCAHQHPQLSPLPDTCKAVYQSHFCWMDHLVDTPKPVALKKCSDLPCPLCVIDFSIYCHNPMRCGNFHLFSSVQFSSVQKLSHVQLFVTPWIAVCQASLSITNSRRLLTLMSIELVMPSSHLILCRPLLLLPPIPPSSRVFSNESTLCIRWPKYWSFSFSISPSNEHPGLISFRSD